MKKKRASKALRLLPILLIGSLGVLLLTVILTVFFEGFFSRSRYDAVQERLEQMAVRRQTNYELLRSSGLSKQESRRKSLELLVSASEYGEYLFIRDSSGNILPVSDDAPIEVQVPSDAITGDGYRIIPLNDSNLFVGIAPMGIEEFHLVLCCPAEVLLRDYTSLRNGMVSISVLTFTITFLTTLLVSFQPVKRLEEDNRMLSSSGRSIGRKYARQYLYGLITGRHTVNDEFDVILTKYSPFTPNQPFGLLMIQPDQKRRFMENTPKDRALYLFGICNILEELANAAAVLQGFPEEDTSYCIALYQLRENAPLSLFAEKLKYGQQQIQSIYEMTATILLTPVCKTIYQLPDSYESLLQHSYDRLLSGPNSLLTIQPDTNPNEQPSFNWQTSYQKQLQQLLSDLQSGQLQDVSAFTELLRTQAQEWWRFRSALALMTGGIEQCIQLLISTHKLDADFAFSLDVAELDSIGEIETRIVETVRKIDAEVRSAVDRRTMLYVQLTNELIEKHYGDSSYGVQQIAEEVGLSGAYLSKLYKQQTECSILDQLIDCRLRHALALLEESDIPVGEVFESCGYSSVNYFYHIFKKATGVTPKQYRSMTPDQRKQIVSQKEAKS